MSVNYERERSRREEDQGLVLLSLRDLFDGVKMSKYTHTHTHLYPELTHHRAVRLAA